MASSSGEGQNARSLACERFSLVLEAVFGGGEAEQRCFRVHVNEQQNHKSKRRQQDGGGWEQKRAPAVAHRVLSYWCFSPAINHADVLTGCCEALVATCHNVLSTVQPCPHSRLTRVTSSSGASPRRSPCAHCAPSGLAT